MDQVEYMKPMTRVLEFLNLLSDKSTDLLDFVFRIAVDFNPVPAGSDGVGSSVLSK